MPISNAEEFAAFRDRVNGGEDNLDATLTADIDLGGEPWTPIGTSDYQFHGTFDGGGHTITGLYVETDDAYAGLFGYVYYNGRVENLGVVDGTVISTKEGDCYVGGVVGCTQGRVINCYYTGMVSGTGNYIGGVVGKADGTVTNCYYLEGTAGKGIGSGTGTAESKTAGELQFLADVLNAGKSQMDDTDRVLDSDWAFSSALKDDESTPYGRPVLVTIPEGEITELTDYVIPDLVTLKAFGEYINGSGSSRPDATFTFKLTANINLNGEPWEPISTFKEALI